MSKNIVIAILLNILIGIPVLVGTAYSQDKPTTIDKTADPVLLLKVINPDGWDVPGISPNQTFRDRLIFLRNTPVISRNYPLEKTFDTEMVSYTLDAENTLEIKSGIVEVKYVSFYSVGDKPFAFQLMGSPFGYTPGGHRAGVGILLREFYFDEDGDGKFETRYTSLQMPKQVPEWTRRPID